MRSLIQRTIRSTADLADAGRQPIRHEEAEQAWQHKEGPRADLDPTTLIGMTSSTPQQHIESAVSSLRLIWDNCAPDNGDPAAQTAWALAAVAQSNAAIAGALLEVAEAIRESREG